MTWLSCFVLLSLLVFTSGSCRDVEKEKEKEAKQIRLNRKHLRAVFHARVHYINSLRRLFPETNHNGKDYFKYDSAIENFACYSTEDVVAYGSFDSTNLHIGERATYKGPNIAKTAGNINVVARTQKWYRKHPHELGIQREYIECIFSIIKRKFMPIIYYRLYNEGSLPIMLYPFHHIAK